MTYIIVFELSMAIISIINAISVTITMYIINDNCNVNDKNDNYKNDKIIMMMLCIGTRINI